MNENDIIVLDNDQRYTLIQKMKFNNDIYFLAMGIDEEEKIDEHNVVYLKIIVENKEQYVEIVESTIIINQLNNLLKEKYKKLVTS